MVLEYKSIISYFYYVFLGGIMKDIINRKWAIITQINREFDELYHKIEVHYNLSDSCFWVLYILYEAKRPLSQKEICDYWCYNKQTINSALRKLEADGVVRSEVFEGRKKKVYLTEKGRRLAKDTVYRVIEIENEIFASWSDEEKRIYIELTQRYVEVFKEKIKNM